ncbi:MAG: prepilin-type N-terminal cleavage/methylation domain-containing protein [Candidatus Eremiobacterota bacterium]
MSRAERRGLSLPEMLVVLALVGLLGLMIAGVLVFTLRATARGRTQSHMQLQANAAVRRIEADLQRSQAAGISLLVGPPTALAILPILDITDTGSLQWAQEATVYCHQPQQRTLVARRWPPGPPGPSLTGYAPAKLPTSLLLDLCLQPNGTDRLLAQDVADFQVTHPGTGGSLGMPLTLKLKMERQAVSGQGLERYELQRDVLLRNSP